MRRALIAVLVAVLAVVTGSCVPGTGGPGTITVTAYFADSAGLFTGNDVGVLGVPVGRVTEIEPDGDRVKVTLEIDADHPIPADAGAVVVARSVATDRYVELTPVYKKGPKLEDGDTISVESTRTPVDFDQVLQTIDEFATGIAGSKETTEAIKRFVDAGDAAFSGQGGQLHETITKLSQATTQVSRSARRDRGHARLPGQPGRGRWPRTSRQCGSSCAGSPRAARCSTTSAPSSAPRSGARPRGEDGGGLRGEEPRPDRQGPRRLGPHHECAHRRSRPSWPRSSR